MFAERLRDLRKGRGLTQETFAKAFGVSGGAVGMWETGKREPDLATITRLAAFFDVSVDYISGNTNIPDPIPLNIPDELAGVRVAFHRGEFEGLTQSEVDALAAVARTLKLQRENQSERQGKGNKEGE